MAQYYYQIGGIGIAMVCPEFHESDALLPFHTSAPSGHVISYEVTVKPALTCKAELSSLQPGCHEAHIPEEGGTVRVILHDGTREAILTERQEGDLYRVELLSSALSIWDTNLVLKLWQLPELLFAEGEVFLHASMIRVGETAILFTAQKQVGKSTQAGLWEKYRGAEIINGDRALLRKEGGIWFACGSPYCGTSKICKPGAFPLKAIVLLSQAKENRVFPATPRQTISAFLDGCTFDAGSPQQAEKTLDTALDVFSHVPVFCLACTPDEGAVIALENALKD